MLVKAEDANVSAAEMLEFYREEECYPDVGTLIEQIAGRSGLDVDALAWSDRRMVGRGFRLRR